MWFWSCQPSYLLVVVLLCCTRHPHSLQAPSDDEAPDPIGRCLNPDDVEEGDAGDMRLLWEAVNVACIKQVRGLHASNEVRIKLGGGATVSLRRMLHVFVVRETAAGGTGRIPVVVAENQVVAEYGLGKGRRYSGVRSMPEGLPKTAVVAINKAVKLGLTMWEATCSPFAYSRLVKEIVRQKVQSMSTRKARRPEQCRPGTSPESWMTICRIARPTMLLLLPPEVPPRPSITARSMAL